MRLQRIGFQLGSVTIRIAAMTIDPLQSHAL
jgi:hypothetical protein